jgi:hypothetical protein
MQESQPLVVVKKLLSNSEIEFLNMDGDVHVQEDNRKLHVKAGEERFG